LGVTSALPGPGSTQMSMLIGRRRAGWPGLVVGGVCFIAPAFCIVLGLAWLYAHHGRGTVATGILFGVKPVVIAVVAQALWGLSKVAVPDVPAGVLAAGSLGAYFAGVDVLVILAAAGLLLTLVRNIPRRGAPSGALGLTPLPLGPLALSATHIGRVRSGQVFLEFLKLGAVVFGSGYVLLAFLHRDLVTGLGWLGNTRLLDAVAVGQLTPGPVFTTATFIGYLVAGVPGAVLATVGIFLPSFFMVAAAAPLIGRLRRSSWTAGVLDGVNAAAIGLMAGVGVDLARTAFTGPVAVILAVAAAVALLRYRVNSAWVVLAGAAAGVLHALA
ncbi:MAG TPA: chromate efflux transporter, partial [Acidimicrobiales bacterium]|nr:chromate efflux transporter [Acidimicrobiales bacterium]